MTFGSLFAGIGGLDLGLERAGMTCKWQVEIDTYARKVLAKHWPDVPRWDDVCTFPPLVKDWSVDLICGGFPCQDISLAGKGGGLDGERSGLFFEFMRVVSVLRPMFVLLENVSALLIRGFDRVLGSLATLGYDAEWHCIQAADVGAPHIRDRIFVYAHANSSGFSRYKETNDPEPQEEVHDERGHDAVRLRCNIPDTDCSGPQRTELQCKKCKWARSCCLCQKIPDTQRKGPQKRSWRKASQKAPPAITRSDWWKAEPNVGRVVDGFPGRVDRLKCLGNAVVPQVAEVLGRWIMRVKDGS